MTGRPSKGGCGQGCCDSVTKLRIEVFERFVEPCEGKGCRCTHNDQVGDYSGPRPFPTAERIPSQLLTVPRPCDRPVSPKDEAIVSEQVLPASSNLVCHGLDARLDHVIGGLSQHLCAGKGRSFPSICQPKILLFLLDLVVRGNFGP